MPSVDNERLKAYSSEFLNRLTQENSKNKSYELLMKNLMVKEYEKQWDMRLSLSPPSFKFPKLTNRPDPIEISPTLPVNWFIDDVDVIPEDSLLRKIAACIPILGIVSSVMNELSLKESIREIEKPIRIIRRIEVKNHYKIASVVRELFTLAIAVAAVAGGVFSSSIGLGVVIAASAITALFVGIYGYKIYQNRELVNSIQVANTKPSDIMARLH
jgi:hypothetical protein